MDYPTRTWFIKVDSITSLVAYRLTLDAEAIAELKSVSAEARRFAEEVGDRYVGGFPITLETMVAFAKANNALDQLRQLIDNA